MMFNKKLLLLTLKMAAIFFCNAQFVINTNKLTGAINEISNSNDNYKMNFVFSSLDSNYSWQKLEQDWGLGKYTVDELGVQNEKWNTAHKHYTIGNKTIVEYKTKCLDIDVVREKLKNDFVETYSFTNKTNKTITVNRLDINTPFNDSYPEASVSATNRCNAHVWAGMHSSYVNAIRMNGIGTHLGLVFTQGAMKSYSIDNRDRHKNVPWAFTGSNIRGVIVLNIASFTLKPNETYIVQWKLFWHNGWKDFYSKALAEGFVQLNANKYVVEKKKTFLITITDQKRKKIISVPTNSLGEHSYKYKYNNDKKSTVLNYFVVSNIDSLINRRARFIVQHQQMNKLEDARNGAYMVYDNDADTIFSNIKLSVAPSDKDEGRERLGMGVFLAKWLQTHDDDVVKISLLRYVKFVREKLQTTDYKVFSNVAHSSKHRGYNYAWVAHLYLETFKLTNNEKHLNDFYATLMKYFKEFGYEHYSIDFRVKDGLHFLKTANMIKEYENLLNAYLKVGDFFVKTGINYPKHEVNYEQSIVAPAVTFLCELYLVTNNKKYLDAAKIQLRSLEAFSGKQPDVHLNEIAIRHWDGYWFGKTPTWGDVMPHYWSTLTAIAFHQYYLCTKDENYEASAKKIVQNNLLNFKEDGRASCAYLYPAFINEKQGKFYDAFANDQDWALVFYHEVMGK